MYTISGRNVMTYNTLNYSHDNGIAVITLNRPEVRNALNDELIEEMESLLRAIERDDQVRVVIVTGHEGCFSAGADIGVLKRLATPLDAQSFWENIYRVTELLETIPQPVIAAVSGIALGGGCEISLACDLRLAAEDAIFGQPEINLGVIPGAGGIQRLARTIGLTMAKELLFTGRIAKAEEALRLGLVNRVVPVSDLLNEAKAMAAKIAEKPAVAVKVTKMCLRDGLRMNLSEALAYEGRCFEFLFSTKDYAEGVSAFLEKRKPRFTGR
jgi:enoyl-CoA hydratase